MLRDPLLQRRAFPIAQRIGVQHNMRRRDGGRGGAGRRLAELHMDDGAPLRGQIVGQAADGHGAEGFDSSGHGAGI
jgi:hypothetical protein